MIKICGLSDLHGHLPEIEPCDLVLICGDSVPLDIQSNSYKCFAWYKQDFKNWAIGLPCDKVLFIAGNHELTFPQSYNKYKTEFYNESKVTYLCDEEYVYVGKDNKAYHIYGTPHCKQFGSWAFMHSNPILEGLFEKIPEGLDVLMTHDTPYGYGDIVLQDCPWKNGSHTGNKPLTNAILMKQPRIQVSGHIHSCQKGLIKIGNTDHYNVSIKDETYTPVYPPTYIELD